eukprot:scaffold81317_cov68-Cyclotella_meneghiniana.AAC.10
MKPLSNKTNSPVKKTKTQGVNPFDSFSFTPAALSSKTNENVYVWREEMMIATFGVKWTWDPSIHDVEIYGVRYYDFIHDDCRKVAQRFREKR